MTRKPTQSAVIVESADEMDARLTEDGIHDDIRLPINLLELVHVADDGDIHILTLLGQTGVDLLLRFLFDLTIRIG